MWHKHLGVWIVILVLITACGGKDADTPKAAEQKAEVEVTLQSPETEPDTQTTTSIVLPCGGMTSDAAAEILGVAAEDITYDYSEEMVTCSYRVTFSKSITYSMYVEADPATAESEMADVVEGLEFLVDCEPVAGVAEAAMYCNGDTAERLLVREGLVWLDIRAPTGLDAMTRVAQQVLR